jgi:hypothetical protein
MGFCVGYVASDPVRFPDLASDAPAGIASQLRPDSRIAASMALASWKIKYPFRCRRISRSPSAVIIRSTYGCQLNKLRRPFRRNPLADWMSLRAYTDVPTTTSAEVTLAHSFRKKILPGMRDRSTPRRRLHPVPTVVFFPMRYLVKARIKPGREADLLRAIDDGSLGRGSVAGDEYLDDMREARITVDGMAHWVETCFCAVPLAEERPYWETFFDLVSVKDAHARRNCRHENGREPWACCDCDCTRRLEQRMKRAGEPFLQRLRATIKAEATDARRHAAADCVDPDYGSCSR